VIYATYRRSAAIDITLKYVTILNDVNVNNDGSYAKKKIDTPEYKRFEHLRANTFETVLHGVGITYLNPDIYSACSIRKHKTHAFTLQINSNIFVANTGRRLQNKVMFWLHLTAPNMVSGTHFFFDTTLLRHMRLTWMTSPINVGTVL